MFNTKLPCDPEITLLYIPTHPREVKAYAPIKTYTQTLIATLLIIAKKREQHKCPSAGEQTGNAVSPYRGSVQPHKGVTHGPRPQRG